jgi:multimeric flavodoxin WrbA
MRIIGLAASPRNGGNSEILLDEVLAGAAASGATVEKVRLADLGIKPCQACDACRRVDPSRCVVKDDMQPLYDQLRQADLWVLATPIYWWGPAAQLKLAVDRWYGFPGGYRSLAGKQAALVVTMGDDVPETARPTVDLFGQAFAYLKMKLHDPFIVSAYEKGAVREQPDALRLAREYGAMLATCDQAESGTA